MSPRNQFGDTTYTKVFVGGLPWETQKETMKNYFDQFGHILEAVVITDKNTGRSKGYGFVTFSEPEAAMRACADPAPVIDGRRANCNLAFFGVQKSTPTTPQNGSNGGMNRAMKSFAAGSGTPTVFPQPAIAAGLPHYTAAIQPHISSYHLYGYHPYTAEYNYPSNYYNMYGGGVATAQYPQIYGAGAVAAANGAYYPYFQIGQQGATGTGATAYGHASGYPSNFQGYNSMQYPHMFQYPSSTTVTGFGQQYYGASGASMALTPAATPQPGMTGMTVAATTAAANPYGLLSTTPSPSSAFE